MNDDDLQFFASEGVAQVSQADTQGYVAYGGADIWYASYGCGPAVVLLHGAFGHSGEWGRQIQALNDAGFRTIAIDSRGRGRSTRGTQPFSYDLMASETLAVLDALGVGEAAIVGWSDGAIIGLILAMKHATRVTRVFAFAACMDLSGLKPVSASDPIIARYLSRAMKDYAEHSPTPEDFKTLSTLIERLTTTEPNYRADHLATIRRPVAIVTGETDEFIERAHVEYLAHTIPSATLSILPEVSHFAPLQRPDEFNDAMLAFLCEE